MSITRSTPASEAWRSLLTAFTDINNELACELAEETGVQLVHYEILLMLYEAGEEGLRPSVIADKRRLSRSGATRLIDRLVEQGIIERRSCGTDGRVSNIVLAEEGRRTFKRAGRVHLEGIERHVGERMTLDELAELQRLLDKLGPSEKRSTPEPRPKRG